MSFGQRNVATYIHNIYYKWHLGSWGAHVVDAKEDNIQLKTLTSGGKYSVLKYTEASTVQIYEPRHEKMCLREFPTRSDSNRPAQLQKLA